MSFLNAICDAAFSKDNHHNRNNATMSTTVALERSRTVLKSIVQQLSSSTSRPNPMNGIVQGDSMTPTSAAPPLQLSANVTMQCPGLSLQAGSDQSTTITNHPTQDRTQAKDHAIKLLARPMTFVHHHDQGMRNTAVGGADAEEEMQRQTTRSIFTSVGRSIQQNVFASFALLVDRRLNAYTNVLTRHAIVLSSMYHPNANVVPVVAGDDRPVTSTTVGNDSRMISNAEEDVVNSKMFALNEKKVMIQKKGAQTEAHALTSNFQLLAQKQYDTITEHEEHQTTAVAVMVMRAPIRYTVTMELHIPDECENEKKKIIPVSFSTTGFIKCAFSKENDCMLQSVKINLNTKDLLESMVRETTRAVSIVVEVANRLCHPHSHDTPRPSLPRSVSYLAMPPPPPIMKRAPEDESASHSNKQHYRRSILDGTSNASTTTDTTGLDLLCSAVVCDGVPVVSPQLSNAPSPKHHITIDLTLDDESRTNNVVDDDVSRLSLDQCADIVDVCLFGDSFDTNHYDMASPSPSPSKRIKIEQ